MTNLNNLTTSLELSKHLRELGVKQDSLFYWMQITDESSPWSLEYKVTWKGKIIWDSISAYTAGELGELLPGHLQIDKYQSSKYLWGVYWSDMKLHSHTTKADKLVDAMAEMLIYLLTSNLITLTK